MKVFLNHLKMVIPLHISVFNFFVTRTSYRWWCVRDRFLEWAYLEPKEREEREGASCFLTKYSQVGPSPTSRWEAAAEGTGCDSHRSSLRLPSWPSPLRNGYTQSSSSSLLKILSNKNHNSQNRERQQWNINPFTWLKKQDRVSHLFYRMFPIWTFPTPAKCWPLPNLIFPFPLP